MAATFTTKDGELIYLLNLTSISEQEDGTLLVSVRGTTTQLTKQDAHTFKMATSGAYRAQQEQPPAEVTALQLVRKVGALG